MKTNQIITFFILSICAISLSQQNTPLFNPDKLVTEKKKKFIDFYFQAEKHKLLEEHEEARRAYEKCISIISNECTE